MVLAHQIAGFLGILVNLAFGIVGLFRIEMITRSVGIGADAPHGKVELRVLLGGVFMGLAVVLLVYPSPDTFRAAAFVYFGAVLARLIGQAMDKPALNKALPGMAMDVAVGLLLLAGSFTEPLVNL